jgi:hypothetical protein
MITAETNTVVKDNEEPVFERLDLEIEGQKDKVSEIDITGDCQLTFEQKNIYEISHEFQDEGYPYFSFSYPDDWSVDEHHEMGYAVNFFSPLSTQFLTKDGEIIDMPRYGMSIYILSEDYKNMDKEAIATEFFSWWKKQVTFTEPDVYLEDPIFSYVIGDSEGREWILNYEIFSVEDDVFVFEVFGTGSEYMSCIDYLVYSYIWDEERLNF